jgi:MFS transporter, ACS family, glucarate transporter
MVKYRYRVLTFLSFLAAITYLDRTCIAVAGPRMQDELHLGPKAWGIITAAFTLAYALFEIPGGYLGDRFGSRLMLTRIVLWWSAFTALTGPVSRFTTLVLVRFCFGAGEAGAYPGASISIFNWFPAVERGRAFGFIWMFSQFGSAFAPLLVVPIQAAYGWRASFYVFGLLGVIWAVGWAIWYRNRPEEMRGVTESEIAEIGAASQAPTHTFPSKPLFRNKSVWAVMGAAWAFTYGYYFFLFWLPTYLVRARGFSEQELRLSALPFVIGGIANLCGGFARDAAVKKLGVKWGQRSIGLVGLSMSAICVLAAVMSADKYASLIWLALSYAAITFQQTTVWAVCVDIGKQYAGAVAGCMNTAAALGGFTSSLLFGVLVEHFGGYEIPLMTMAAILFLGAALWLRVDGTEELSLDASLRPGTVTAAISS